MPAAARGRQHQPGGHDVVGVEDGGVEAADLGVELDDGLGARERVLPAPGAAEVRLDDADVGVEAGQDAGVGAVLVDGDDVGIAAGLEARDEVLAHEAGRARHDDAPAPARAARCLLIGQFFGA